MEARDLDDSASFTCDRESSTSTPVQVVMEKDVEKLTICDDPMLNQVASMPYRHCRVPIFKKADRFFYDPIVLLEDVTLLEQERPDGQVEATLKIKLWDYDLERRIISYLRYEVGEVGLKAHQVQVMPYEEIQLVAKENIASFRVLTEALFLHQLPVEVTFKLLFSSVEEADLGGGTEFLAHHLEIHFTGQSPQRLQGTAKCESAFRVHRNTVFEINIISQSIGSRDDEAIAKNLWQDDVLSKIRNLDDRVNGLQTAIQNKACVPVFVASTYLTISKAKYVTYAELTLNAGDIHGVLDKTTGVFSAKSAGMYLFQFEGLASICESLKIQLKVNGITKVKSQSCSLGPKDSSEVQESGSLSVSCLLHVKSGDQIGVFLENGVLLSNAPKTTRFWGILLC